MQATDILKGVQSCRRHLTNSKPHVCGDEPYVWACLMTDNMSLCVNPEHPLAEADSVNFSQLRNEKFIMDMAKIRENYREAAAKNVKMDLLLEQVAKAEEIKVEAADLDAEVEAMAKTYGATPEQVKKIIAQQGRLGDLAATVLRRKTAQFIVDNAAE